MRPVMTSRAFRCLVDTLQQPAVPVQTEPYWPYPLPEAEMIARYGLRRLTLVEQAAFPGVRLALWVFKARLTQPPATVPGARAGWAFGELSRAVVWVAETYRGHFLVCIPGGGTLPVPYNEMEWTAVADETPVTTLADAQAQERQRQWRRAVSRNLRQCLLLPAET